jgi:autotransporter-associated beta strand protein
MPDTQKFCTCFNRRIKIHTLAAIALLLIYPTLTKAANNYWNVTSGNWSDTYPSPWSLGIEPTTSDNAYIQNGGTANISQTGEQCSSLYLGAANTGTVDMDGGSLSVGYGEYVGYSGTGTFTQTGGINAIPLTYFEYGLWLGYNTGSSGTYKLSDAGQLSASYELIGYSGSGTFTQTGGINSITNYLYLGYNYINNSGSSCTYNLSSTGQLYAPVEYIGYYGTGKFTQSGGTNSISSALQIGAYSGSSGTYNLSGGTLSTTNLNVKGSGRFEWFYNGLTTTTLRLESSSTLAMGFDFDIATLTSASLFHGRSLSGLSYATLEITNGATATQSGNTSVSVQYLMAGSTTGNGTYNLSNTGQLSVGYEYIGYSGTGTFTQTGGKHIIDTFINIGYKFGATGTYNLSGTAQLSADKEIIGFSGSGSFIQNGGKNLVSSSTIFFGYDPGAIGSYDLSGTGYLSASGETIGYYGTGTFTQTGGINVVASKFVLGSSSSSRDNYYYLSDTGQLFAGDETIGNGTGTFNQSGGTNSITNSLTLGIYSGSIGTYNLTGGTLITKSISKGSGTAAFNFGGGTLKAGAAFTSSLDMNLNGIGSVTGTLYNATVDTAGVPVTLSGILSGVGGLNKSGSGTLSLSGLNTYYGETNVNVGTLALTSTGLITNSSVIDVKSGAYFNISAKTSGFSLGATQTLKGNGTILGSVVAATGSYIKPGDSAGTLTLTGNLTLEDGALLDFELASISTSDLISLGSSTLYLNNQDFSDFNFTALSGFGQGMYTLIDAGIISGNLGDNPSGTIDGYFATISKSGNDLVLNVVPEPGTWALLAAACLGLFVGKRMGKK